MINKETWNVRTDRDKMENLIKYNMLGKCRKKTFLKLFFFSKNVKKNLFPMNDSFFNTLNKHI